MPTALAETDLLDERDLVRRAQAGDRDSLGRLLRQFGPDVYRTVLLPRLGNPVAAEQALADTYARVVERISQFEWQGVSFRAWLRTVALRVALDLLRSRRREVLFLPEELESEVDEAEQALWTEDPAEQLERADEHASVRQKLEEALNRLHPRYAQAIRLRIIDELPREDVARKLSVSPATFDVVLHRALAALRKIVSGAESDFQNRGAR